MRARTFFSAWRAGRVGAAGGVLLACLVLGPSPASAAPEDPHLAVSADLAGSAMLGLTTMAEYGGRATMYARARWVASGFLGRLIADEVVAPVAPSSVGFAVGGRRYAAARAQSGRFVGAGLEYVHLLTKNENDALERRRHLLVPQIEAGYLWVYEGGMSFSMALAVGDLVRLYPTAWSKDRKRGEDDRGKRWMAFGAPVAALQLELGYVFGSP